MQQRQRVHFAVKVGEGAGTTFIALEPADGEYIDALAFGFLIFDLNPNTTLEEATRIAALLNERIVALTFLGEDPDTTPTSTLTH
jgi:hypothetical protein